jgi:hypothetical protein
MMDTAITVEMIRREPPRYKVIWEAVYVSDHKIAQHMNDDWDCTLVYRDFSPERSFFFCLRHGAECMGRTCKCIDEVKRHREEAGLTELT